VREVQEIELVLQLPDHRAVSVFRRSLEVFEELREFRLEKGYGAHRYGVSAL